MIELIDLDDPDGPAPLVQIPTSEGTKRYLIGAWIARGALKWADAELLAYFLSIPLWAQKNPLPYPPLMHWMLTHFLGKEPSTFRIPSKEGSIYEFQQQAKLVMHYFSIEEQERIKNFLDAGG